MRVTRTVHVNVPRLFKRVRKTVEEDAVELGVERAKEYAPVDTGNLKFSIQAFSDTTFGSEVRAARYQERVVPTYTKTTPFLKPAAEDVAKAIPRLFIKAFGRWARG